MLRELNDDETGLDELDLDAPLDLEDELAVRSAMIRLQQLDRDIETVKARRDAVAATYNQQIDRYQRDVAYLRSSLQAYLERHPGNVKFPDVGTAYLAKGDPKVEIADREALKAELGAMFTKETFDETAAKNYALEQALEGNPIPAGINIVPGGPRLQVRKA